MRELNLYHEGDRIPASQVLSDLHLQQCWNELMTKIKYDQRVTAIEDFNKLVIVKVTRSYITLYSEIIIGRNEVSQ